MAGLISFKDDYSELGHPRLIEAMGKIAREQNATYGLDKYSAQAGDLIRKAAGSDCYVHLISGGTQANAVNLSSILRPYESVIACDSAHINVHETGAVEATGHKINVVKNLNGKLSVADIEAILKAHHFEHMVMPRVVYVSQSTEIGTVYSKAELTAISQCCKKHGLYLYLDGARLGAALAAKGADLTLKETVALVDMLYMGGTKNGGIYGEAVLIPNKALSENYRYSLKQFGALMAKGMGLGIQFTEFFKDGLYIELARHANDMAMRMVDALEACGATFKTPPQTNQIFATLPLAVVEALEKEFGFYRWSEDGKGNVTIRLVTSWATRPEDVEAFGKSLATFNKAA